MDNSAPLPICFAEVEIKPPLRILVKLSSRSRPRQFRTALNLMVEKATDPDNIHFLFTIDRADPRYPDYIKAPNGIAASFEFDAGLSTSKEKALAWDIFILASHDMHCQRRGWDQQIRLDMQEHFPDTDGCLWYSDGYRPEQCRLPIMGRKYYQRNGYLAEWQEAASRDDRLLFVDLVLFCSKGKIAA